jgi:hypothetical protein
MVCFTACAWSAPNPQRLWPTDLNAPPANQSLSGKIASIRDATFSLEITQNQDKKTVKFVVDEKTKVEGKLPWALSDLGIPFGNDVNLAIQVVVTPASAVNSY